MTVLKSSLWKSGVFFLIAGPALAQSADVAPSHFSMNTMFVVFCGILVMFMTAGFTMMEAGFVRAKNVVNQCAKNVGLFSIASFAFLVVGFGLMFPAEWTVPGIFGTFSQVNLGPVAEPGADLGATGVAHAGNVFFQMMFAATVASIVSGALAERIRLLPFFFFTAFLAALIYPVQASWSWGGGFLTTVFDFKDLAGSTVVHVVGGVAALTGSIVLGAREGRFESGYKKSMNCYSLPLATLGGLVLWMGWFGFNAGSYLSISTDADASNVSRIMLNTQMGAAGGAIAAATISYLREYRFDLSFMINGALAGLVSITAEPLFPNPIQAVSIGMIGGLVLFWAIRLLEALEIDDVVGAVPVHLFCGVWGTLAVVLSNPEATLYGQAASVAIVAGFVAVSTMIVWLALKATIGLRVSAQSETIGTDAGELVLEI